MFLLGACATKPGGTASLHSVQTPSVTAIAAPASLSASKDGSEASHGDDKAGHSSISPAALKALSSKELLARYGQPDFTRRDPPAEIWQYRGVGCVLDVFLYPSGDDLHVAHAVTRDPTSSKTAGVYCSPFAVPRAAAG